MRSRIVYIESKANGLSGPARIGRVMFSRSGRSLYYCGRQFQRLRSPGFKANYFDVKNGEEYWISGCKHAGGDRLYPGTVDIDDDVREEYGTEIRRMRVAPKHTNMQCRANMGARQPQ